MTTITNLKILSSQKMKIFLIVIFVGVIMLGFILWSEAPIVFGRGSREAARKIENTEAINLQGKTLFISDLHLQDPEQKIKVDLEGVKNLVIVGDFFNSPGQFLNFGADDKERIKNGLATFLPEDFSGDEKSFSSSTSLRSVGNVYFIVGTESHDPRLSISFLDFGNTKFYYLGELGKFKVDGVPVVAFHGQYLHDGFVGAVAAGIGQKLNYPLALERLSRRFFKIDKETWIITGHSHIPALHQESKTANTGSFAGLPFNSILKFDVGTGILFEGGAVSQTKSADALPTVYCRGSFLSCISGRWR